MPVISGVVVSADGQAVPDARVYVTGGPSPLPDVAALTDGQGRFALTAGADGTYTVECRAERDGAPLVRAVTVTVRGRNPAEVEIRLG